MSQSLSLVIFGTGSVARIAHYVASYELGLEVVGFAVDPAYRVDTKFLGLPVLDADLLAQFYPPGTASVFVAVGYRSMHKRSMTWRRFADAGWNTPSLISSKAYVAETAKLGANCLVLPGVVVEPGCILGDNNILWSNATICHDSCVGSDNFLAAGTVIGGEVEIGSRSFFGFSSIVLQHRTVGCDVLLAAAALLTADAPNLGYYKGIPAKRIGEICAEDGVCIG